MERLTPREALERYEHAGLHELGAEALAACSALHPETYRTYAIDRNINYTNVCTTGCKFCAYHVRPGGGGAFVLSPDDLLEKVRQLQAVGGTHVLLQGGMNPDLGFDFHLDMLRRIKAAFPAIGLHAFSPPEIWYFHRRFGLPLERVIARLVEAGLDSIPGGGAEILVDDVRQRIAPLKCTSKQWLDVMRQAHRLGLRTTATMMLGHVESLADRIEHLRLLRELQDESLQAGRGHFTAFICWTFQSGHTQLLTETLAAGGRAEPLQAGPYVYLRTLAIARLFLDNFANLQASWVTQGEKIGQLSLFYGANDMGGAMMEENVVAAAGTSYHLKPEDIRRLIASANWQPRQRDCAYHLVE